MEKATAPYDPDMVGDVELACETLCVSLPEHRAAKASLVDYDFGRMAALLGALGDPTRLRLVASLLDRRLCTCDLAVVLRVSESAVSHQLRLLKELRLVRSTRQGKFVYHELADDHAWALIEVAADYAREDL